MPTCPLFGRALSYYSSLTTTEKDTYDYLKDNLCRVLCPAIDREQHFADFERSELHPDEDPQIFLWELTESIKRADRALTKEAKEALLSQQFLEGLPSDLRLRLLDCDPHPS